MMADFQIQVDEVLQLPVIEHHPLLLELAEACIRRSMWEKALDCLAEIQECEEVRFWKSRSMM